MKNVLTSLVIFAACMALGTQCLVAEIIPANMAPALDKVMKGVNNVFADINKDLSDAAKKLSDIGDLRGPEALGILGRLCEGRTYLIDCAIVDTAGKIVSVEPKEYKKYEGSDISAQAHADSLRKTKKPVMSGIFKSAEGMNAVAIAYPIVSGNGDLLGSVSMLVRPDALLGGIAAPLVKDAPWKVWVMQTDGLVLYDQDPNQINKNVFTDAMFEPFRSLIQFAETAARQEEGVGYYEFYTKGYDNKTVVKKDAIWDTVALFDTKWRVIVMEIGKAGE